MVKLTIVGRVEDGLPLAQDQTYVNQQDNASFLLYKQQAEFLLKQISKDSLLHPKMTILLDHHSFHFLVEKNICYIALSDSSYPRKLLFHYLQDLHKELDNLDETALIQKISKPYSFVRFGKIIGRIRKQYMDTRTQANLSKLNSLRKQELNVVTEHFNDIIQRRQILETSEKASSDPRMSVSTIWSSRCLHVYMHYKKCSVFLRPYGYCFKMDTSDDHYSRYSCSFQSKLDYDR
ncbi:Longin-like domain superfamily [Arabidopsis thaliana x Arabidopsis arenosa]|uniref:Longin-like domain superfamily n=1 Tax=Arabidopsis thaliana x Arabidopsis arenosa TaxID=1240361 RepID=A0A8T1XMU5_9BRAS|nr:Longin-like domain superfamily [Arabidopsis thaliana x Arabidopsis arenosa]